MNQCNKGLQETPFYNMENGFQRKEYHSTTQNNQGENKLVNMGFKKVGDNHTEPFKSWECGEHHMWKHCPHLNPSSITPVHNIEEDSIVGDIGRSVHNINATLDGI
jgi:hypothetical protein